MSRYLIVAHQIASSPELQSKVVGLVKKDPVGHEYSIRLGFVEFNGLRNAANMAQID